MENETKNIYEKLSNIQNEMNVPKNLFNKFGNYYYRNAETILDSAKPICAKNRTTLIVNDEISLIGERYYVKAMAILQDWDSDKYIVNIAYAREEETKKGMDASQVTGSTSSYARKYALNGLFNLDDVKDADSNEQSQELKGKGDGIEKATQKQVEIISKCYTGDNLKKLLEANNITKLEDMPKTKASELISKIRALQNKQGENNNAN